uniref:Calcium voltage-gated channel subunit alpha1 H n=1 Tax=Lynx canadensis TaxID=61383 RepID=A0A667J674_LYNCA
MTEGAQAADEVRVPLGAPAAGSAVAAGASPASPGAPGREAEPGSGAGASPPESPAAERGAELGADEEQPVPYPALAATVFFCLGQTTRPRSWCLRLVCNPYPSRHVSMLVIMLNCVTLGMFRPCEDVECRSERCSILEAFDDFIFAFFAVEMIIKMVALGLFGQKCYLGDTWNRLDFFIVMAGMMEYSLDGHNVSLSAIRTVRVLRPLRAINRVPSMRILVTLLLDTLPMLGNVLLLCFFVFFIFGIVGVQLWAGLLRNRCFLDSTFARWVALRTEEGEENPFICSSRRDNGMQKCSHIPSRRELRVECTLGWEAYGQPQAEGVAGAGRNACINWNQYYNVCRSGGSNPHNGAINFDNIGYAWIAIFQVITLEGWVDIMYYVMDAHSFYNFIYFILLIIVGSFFMINLCLVVIATQFSETKQRENQLMREQRARYLSNDSTLASFSEPGSCYEELLKYVGHVCRKVKRRGLRLYARWQSRWRQKVDPGGTLHGQGPGRLGRAPSRLSGLSVPCPLPSPQAGTLTCELKSCPYCASAPEDPDFELSDSESGGSEGNGVYEFTQDVRHGDRRDPMRPPAAADAPGQGSARQRARRRAAPGEQGGPGRVWAAFGGKLRRIVDSKYFNRGIMVAILTNTLSMGVEYHEQPDELTNALEISNIVFTSVFALEMLLKLLACGPLGYIRNPYNIFDGIIVVISVWEIVGQADGGLSVLRTFRLLRVLKLVRFMPALRRQLVVLMKTMDNVATFCMLLMLFIFIFSILGMHLFGCKFSLTTDTGDTVPDRKNFDSLLWAIVTVFQILTQEDWNVVLYNGMASTSSWAALYFVALMTFGNYVLFNLLVAILVEGFQAEVRGGNPTRQTWRASVVWPPHLPLAVISGRALPATPTSTAWDVPAGGWPCSLLTPPHTQSSLRSSPCAHWGPNSAWSSRRSSWNSLGRAPSLKRRSQCGERESLLSGEGKGSTDEEAEDGRPGAGASPGTRTVPLRRAESPDHRSTLDLRPPRPAALLPSRFHDCNGRGALGVGGPAVGGGGRLGGALRTCVLCPQSCCLRLRKVLEPYKPAWCRSREPWALYLFSPQNRFRVSCQKIIAHKMFDHVVLVFIFLNCITIALERPDIDPSSTERVFLSVSNYIFTAIFVAEMMVKVVALGLVSGDHAYLQSSWNVLDGLLVLVSLVDIVVAMASAGGAKILGILRVLRLLRTLRPLRVISRAPGLKLVVETLISSLRPIGNIVLICCAFFIIFGILGVQLFKGKFYYCEGADTRNISTKAECRAARYRWVRRKYNFDNLGQALMSLFVLSSKDGWVNIMYDGLDAVGIDQQPVPNHNPWMLLYFISFLLIVSFFVLNMFVGVVVENFHKCRQHQEAEEARRREEKRQRRLERKRRKAQRRPYYADYSPTRRSIHSLCTSHYLDLFITFIIGVNVITMSMEHYNQPKSLDEALKYCNYVFTIVFVFEAVLKLVAFGFRRFFKDRWNQLDLAIVLLSIMGITLEEIEMNAALPINPTIIRIMRVLRIARGRPPACPVGNLGLLFMLLFFIYAALGVELFGRLECSDDNPCEGLSRHATFSNFGMAFLTLFRVSTGDNWNGIMKDTLRECAREDKHCLTYLPAISPIYFVTFVLVAQFVLVNVVVAVLMKHLEESNKEAREDAELDAELELEVARGPPARPRPAAPQSPDAPGLLVVRKMSGGDTRGGGHVPAVWDDVQGPGTVSPRALVSVPCSAAPLSLARTRRPLSACRGLRSSLCHVPCAWASGPCWRCAGWGLCAQRGLPGHSRLCPREFRSLVLCPRCAPGTSGAFGIGGAGGRRVRLPWGVSVLLCGWGGGSRAPGCCLGPARPPWSPDPVSLQEAVRTSSLEGQMAGPRDGGPGWAEPGGKTPVRQASLGASVRSPPRSPRPASVRARKHTFGQRCVSGRPPAPGGEEAEAPDPADEEVSHITSSAQSPSASPDAPGAGGEPDLHGFCGVDAQGFRGQPGQADEQRRPSAEQGGGDGRSEVREAKARVPEAEPPSGARRKKKMSPPCISVDPPAEDEGTARPPAAEGSGTLRRRTPSCEATPHRDSLEPAEGAGADAAAKGERRAQAACRAEHLTVPSFAFEPLDVGGPGGDLFADSGHSVAPEPRASLSGATVPPEPHRTEPPVLSSDPPEKGRGLHLKVLQSPPKKAGSPPATPIPGDHVDKPV